MKDYILTESQQRLVEENMNLVETVICLDCKRIINNPDYDYDDLYQTGCVGLCKAAASFESGNFPAYAKQCIRNVLYDYFRSVRRHSRVESLNALTEDILTQLVDDEIVEDNAIAQLLLRSVQAIKDDYTGVAFKGFTAIELKLKGLSGTDIARMYGVKPNHISAWIARAKKKLMADPRFWQAIA